MPGTGFALAVRPGDPYPATFRLISGTSGNRTPITWVQARRLPVGPTSHFLQRSVRDLNPVFVLTTDACRRNTYRPLLSDRGWNRTIVLLHVTQASSPLDHAIAFVSSRERRRTCKIGVKKLSCMPLCLSRTRLSEVADPGVAPGGPGL